jgi:hypothetical protein
MARKVEPNCIVCGVEKTKANTTLRQGGRYFQSACRKCDSTRVLNSLMSKMSINELERKIKKYERLSRLFKSALEEKKND